MLLGGSVGKSIRIGTYIALPPSPIPRESGFFNMDKYGDATTVNLAICPNLVIESLENRDALFWIKSVLERGLFSFWNAVSSRVEGKIRPNAEYIFLGTFTV